MITISRTFTVAADVEAVLAYLMDFGNTNAWDSATRHTVRTTTGRSPSARAGTTPRRSSA